MDNTLSEMPDASPEGELTGPTRRSFLHRSLTAGAAAVPAAMLASMPATSHAGRPLRPSFGRPLPTLYPGENTRFFEQIQRDENNHVEFLVEFLGGTIDQGGQARPKPAFKGLVAT